MEKIKLLKSLGFTEYESRTYIALSELGPSTAKEITDYSKLPRNKTYETLARLEVAGRIVTLPISPRKFRIADMSQLKEEIDAKKKEVATIEKSLKEFMDESTRRRPKEFKELFWIIQGKKAIIKKLELENSKAKQEILGINRLSVMSYRNLKSMKTAVENGVTARFLVPRSDENKTAVEQWKSLGVEIRQYDEKRFGRLSTRISIFDSSVVRITFGEPDVLTEDDYLSLWAESRYLAKILKDYFLGIWKRSKQF